MAIILSSPTSGLMLLMQVSVLIPLLVCWRRWPALPVPLRWLGWYFPLSIAGTAAGRGLAYAYRLGYHVTNHPPITAFNVGKTLLLGLVLRQVLRDQGARRITEALLGLGLAVVGAGFVWLPSMQEVTLARLAQCVVLAVVALAYLEQLSRHPDEALADDPYFWLSMGQLAYSAATTVAIGLSEADESPAVMEIYILLIAAAGLFQNFTLTKAYLAGRRPAGATPF